MDALATFLFEGFSAGSVLEGFFLLVMAAILANRGVKRAFQSINTSVTSLVSSTTKLAESVAGIEKELREVKDSVMDLSHAMRSVELQHEARIQNLEKQLYKYTGESQGE